MLCVICNTTKIYGNLSEVHLKRGALRKTFMTWKMKRSFFFVYVFCVHGICLMHSPRLYAHHVTVKRNQPPPPPGLEWMAVLCKMWGLGQRTRTHWNMRIYAKRVHICTSSKISDHQNEWQSKWRGFLAAAIGSVITEKFFTLSWFGLE